MSMLEAADLHKLRGIDQWFLDMGFVLTSETPVYVLEQVEFCQAHPVWVGDGYRMVRDIRTTPAKDMVSLLGWDNASNFNAWRNAIAACGQSLTSGVPVWESFYNALGEAPAPDWAEERIWDTGMGYMAKGVETAQITERGRYSFYLAFGMTPDWQVAIEESFSPISFSEPQPMTFADVDCIKSPLQQWLESGITEVVPMHAQALLDL